MTPIPPLPAGPLRLLPLAAATPARNMAVDAALLEASRVPTLRLYLWRPHGVSLGRFQKAAGLEPFRAAGLPVVRRMTGGGAIVHAHEVTYALLLPADHPQIAGADVKASYAALQAPIRAALAALGVGTTIRPEPVADARAREFLCFARATELDLAADGGKLVGSAQRRIPGRVLQHGSILLRAHPLQPGTASVASVAGRDVDAEELARGLATSFAAAFGPLIPGTLTDDEEAEAARVEPTVVVDASATSHAAPGRGR